MSDTVKASVQRGIDKKTGVSQITVEIEGKITTPEWEAFKQQLKKLAKDYGLTLSGL